MLVTLKRASCGLALVALKMTDQRDKKLIIEYSIQYGYSIQVRWANVQAIDLKFSQDLTQQKSLKSVNF